MFSCSASKQTRNPEDTKGKKSSKYDESFNPHTLKDDDIVISKADKQQAEKKQEKITAIVNEKEEALAYIQINGFRVQLLLSKSVESATVLKEEAGQIFAADDHKVYLIFDAPNYKVRVGDARTRDEAESIRELARSHGFRDAFIVKSKVNVPRNEEY